MSRASHMDESRMRGTLRRVSVRIVCISVAGAVAGLASSPAWVGGTLAAQADPGFDIPWGSFVYPGQGGPQPNIGGRCAATATVNSFVYLNNARPDRYGGTTLLTGPNATGTPNLPATIRLLDDLMGGAGCGVSVESMWEGKYRWILHNAPRTTVFHGMVNQDFSRWFGGESLTRGIPTFDFLLRMLRAGEDVELVVTFAGGGSHAVTLSGLSFADLNGNGVWDPGNEGAMLRYIDPNCPLGRNASSPAAMVTPLIQPGGEALQFGWVQGNGTVCGGQFGTKLASVYAAFAESPAPEPSTLALVASAGVVLVFLARRRPLSGAGTEETR